MRLHKLVAVRAFGPCILSAPASANPVEDHAMRPFEVQVPQAALENSERNCAR